MKRKTRCRLNLPCLDLKSFSTEYWISQFLSLACKRKMTRVRGAYKVSANDSSQREGPFSKHPYNHNLHTVCHQLGSIDTKACIWLLSNFRDGLRSESKYWSCCLRNHFFSEFVRLSCKRTDDWFCRWCIRRDSNRSHHLSFSFLSLSSEASQQNPISFNRSSLCSSNRSFLCRSLFTQSPSFPCLRGTRVWPWLSLKAINSRNLLSKFF